MILSNTFYWLKNSLKFHKILTPLTARVDPRSTAKQGDKNLRVALDPNRMHLFDKETEETIIN